MFMKTSQYYNPYKCSQNYCKLHKLLSQNHHKMHTKTTTTSSKLMQNAHRIIKKHPYNHDMASPRKYVLFRDVQKLYGFRNCMDFWGPSIFPMLLNETVLQGRWIYLPYAHYHTHAWHSVHLYNSTSSKIQKFTFHIWLCIIIYEVVCR